MLRESFVWVPFIVTISRGFKWTSTGSLDTTTLTGVFKA
jgi:hypothetical protein